MDAEFWTALGFVCFILLAIFYFKSHTRIGTALDARGSRIRDELDEAERLRREAAAVLASFEGKRADAEKEAATLVEQARQEAELIAREAEQRLADFVRRRTKQAEQKIANAETLAMAQVRAAAADAATAAAEIVLREDTKGGFADRLVEQGIGDVKRLAH